MKNISANTTNPVTMTEADVAPAIRPTWEPDDGGSGKEWTLVYLNIMYVCKYMIILIYNKRHLNS